MNYHVVVFHKCASNWTRRLFLHVAEHCGFNVTSTLKNSAEINKDVDRGSGDTMMIYARGAPDFRKWQSVRRPGEKVVLCVRDPKDALVSQFWSWRQTHAINAGRIAAVRPTLQALDAEEGIEKLIQEDVFPYADSAKAWSEALDDPSIHLLKYEDLLDDFSTAMRNALDHLGIDVGEEELARMQEAYSFKATTGRDPGEEHRSSHYRKGIAGDWRGSFSESAIRLYNDTYGDLFKKFGYPLAD